MPTLPSERFQTVPVIPNERARRAVAHRKPTPCTNPETT